MTYNYNSFRGWLSFGFPWEGLWDDNYYRMAVKPVHSMLQLKVSDNYGNVVYSNIKDVYIVDNTDNSAN